MFRSARGVPDGGLLGAMQTTQDGANGWVERIVGRGWGKLNLHSATALLDQGQASVNLVAAIPSLHAGLTLAIAAFLWRRVHRGWRPVLVAYVLVMAFTLVYTAEHFVVDILLGWLLAVVVIFVINVLSRRSSPSAAGEIHLAQRLGDSPLRLRSSGQPHDVADPESQCRAAVGERDAG
jgi:hypothetical protein